MFNFTPNTIYLLGLLWADGYLRHHNSLDRSKRCLYRTTLEIIYTDLIDIKHCFDDFNYNWWFGTRQRPNRQLIGMAVLHSKEFYSFLKSYDYENKSLISPDILLSNIPSNLLHYWWRGYFDGDGCIYIKNKVCQLSLAGSYNQDWSFVYQLNSMLDMNFKLHRTTTKTGLASVVRTTKRSSISNFLRFIYRDYNSIGLTRKHKKYCQFLDTFIVPLSASTSIYDNSPKPINLVPCTTIS